VAGHYRRAANRVAQKAKAQRGPILGGRAFGRKSQAKQRVNDATLRDLELMPKFPMIRHPQIGNYVVETARQAKRVGIFGGNQPITDLMLLAVGALFIGPIPRRWSQRPPSALATRFQRAEVDCVGQETERAIASHALNILEKDQVTALIAVKSFHRD